MALRAFHANPCIGGFGGENSGDILLLEDPSGSNNNNNNNGINTNTATTRRITSIGGSGDALCQIVKELVDNAIDACVAAASTSASPESSADNEQQARTTTVIRGKRQKKTKKKKSKKKQLKVKVDIQPYYNDENNNNDEILQVKITDTGCGMDDIQSCVNAFGSSKHDGDAETAGRYGIGLTLCLLHAQRIIPHKTCITSATKNLQYLTRAYYIVDTDGDSIICDKTETIPKTKNDESGTCVSLLVPGGKVAKSAWPRLRNYFTRFKLSPGIAANCNLEVYAPTLADAPIYIRALTATTAIQQADSNNFISFPSSHEGQQNDSAGQQNQQQDEEEEEEERPWIDGFEEDDNEEEEEDDNDETKRKDNILDRTTAFHAAQSFLGTRLQLENIARSIQPIKIGRSVGDQSMEPKLDVNIVVRSLDEIPESESQTSDQQQEENTNNKYDDDDSSVAKIELVRLVNNIPLLDGAEASACGLVSGLNNNKDLWNVFGLQVQSKAPSQYANSWTPTYEIQDSDQVAPFFRIQNHKLWEQQQQAEPELPSRTHQPGREEEEKNSQDDGGGIYSSSQTNQLMPAKVRLSKILIVVNIQAAPTSLPLPSLSKGRLPLNHGPIDKAFQAGLRSCLRNLQVTNPRLLLTAAQLRYAEREVHHKPALAAAVSRVICRMPNNTTRRRLLSKVSNWENNHSGNIGARLFHKSCNSMIHHQNNNSEEVRITTSIEKQLSSVMKLKEEMSKRSSSAKKRRSSRGTKKYDKNEETDYNDFDGSETEEHDGSLSIDETVRPSLLGDAESSPAECSASNRRSFHGGEASYQNNETHIDKSSPLETTMETESCESDDEWW